MIREILCCCIAVGILNAASFENDLDAKISARTYSLANKKVRSDYRKTKKQLTSQVSVAPEFDKVDLSRYQIQVGNDPSYYGGVQFRYARTIDEVIEYYLRNPTHSLTPQQTYPALVFKADQPDPKRPGYDYTPTESGYVSIISRALPSGYYQPYADQEGQSDTEVLLKALLWKIFSSERAVALYNDIIMQMGEEDPEKQKKAYEDMAKDLGLTPLTAEQKKAEKKKNKKDAQKRLLEIKIFLGML